MVKVVGYLLGLFPLMISTPEDYDNTVHRVFGRMGDVMKLGLFLITAQ